MSSCVGLDVSPNTIPKDDYEPYPYCGPARSLPKPRFNPYRDVFLRDFVLCRPCDGHRLSVWLGCALSTVDYPLVAIMGPFLWSGGHQCVQKRSQSHFLLGSIRLGDGQCRLLIHKESMSPPYCTLTECCYTRTKGLQRRI